MDTSPPVVAALSSPPGRGALAVIRLTGDGAQGIFAGVIRERERFEREAARRVGLYTVINNDNPGDVIDEVTAVKYAAPRSFTGEEMVEIFCHGGAVVPRKILDALFGQGARPAGRGEFSRRAFLNGKMNLLKAESVAGLIDSETETHLRSAQLAYQGRQLESLEKLKRRLIGILADIESRIEFGEMDGAAIATESESILPESQHALNDVVGAATCRPPLPSNNNRRELESIIRELEDELRRSERVRAFDDGVIVALAGPPNAGKSSLFNGILGYDRAIVHDRPGTTRDIVSERVVIDGVSVKLLDSAGIRDAEDAVERRGVELTLSAIGDAHLVIWVTSADMPFDDGERSAIVNIIGNNGDGVDGRDVLVVINKIDLKFPKPPHVLNDIVGAASCRPPSAMDKKTQFSGTNPVRPPFAVDEKIRFCNDHSLKFIETSLTEKINTKNLFDEITAAIRKIVDNIPAPEIIINDRHRSIVKSIIQDLQDSAANFGRDEVSAHYLKKALDSMSEFLGHTCGDEVLGEIFGKFCVGK